MIPKNKKSLEEAKQEALTLIPNLKILNMYRETGKKKNEIRFKILCPNCGKERENEVTLYAIRNNTLRCKKCKHEQIGKTNSIPKEGNSLYDKDLYNRIKYWDYDKNNDSPKDVSYRSSQKRWFMCEKEHRFNMPISDVNQGKWCPHCSNLLKESKMASVLKQVLLNEFPNTIWEYNLGFRGDKGGASHYDIYVPELNLLIECQSDYHDCEEQINLDIKKKQFALDNGYYFLDIDYRDFKPLEAVNLFFPHINQIPEYVDYTRNTRVSWNIDKAQYLLDNTNLNQKEIAEIVGAEIRCFYDKIHREVLILPNEKSIKIPIVQLSLDGKFISRYDYARECELKYGYNVGNICSCCKGNQNTYKGCLWMYESDYDNKKDEYGNIKMSNTEIRNIEKWLCKEVVQLSLKGEYIRQYKTISEASNETGFKISNISACCWNKVKTSNRYIWMFEKDYNLIKDKYGNIDIEIKFNEYRIRKQSKAS